MLLRSPSYPSFLRTDKKGQTAIPLKEVKSRGETVGLYLCEFRKIFQILECFWGLSIFYGYETSGMEGIRYANSK